MTSQLPIVIFLGVAVFVLAGIALWSWKSRRDVLGRFAPILDADAELKRIKSLALQEQQKLDELEKETKHKQTRWETEYKTLTDELAVLSQQIDTVHDLAEMQSFGLYEPVFDFDTAEAYKLKIKEISDQQKQMVKAKQAAMCSTQWSVEGSKKKGEAMTNRQLKLMLRAFNGECSTAVSQAKFNNVVALQERIRKSFKAVNDLGKSNFCELTQQYLQLKLSELQAAYEYADKKQKEKEEQAQLRQMMREEDKVRKEIAKAENDAAKDEQSYEKALEKARAELAKDAQKEGDAKQEALRKKVAILEQQLQSAHENKAQAIARSRLTKSGHVYVISNIGSFGQDVFKIGMTRRIEPLDRVKELGDASVPFRFDVHAMVYSEDAPALENLLHSHFKDQQVNLINSRKEFFQVTLDEVEKVIAKQCGAVDFVRTAVAEEYRESAAIRAKIAAQRAQAESDIEDAAVEHARNRLAELKAGWVAEPVT